MDGVEVILSRTVNTGHFDRMTESSYDVIKRKATYFSYGGDKEDATERSKKRFEEDINIVKRLARKEIDVLTEKITNNKRVLMMFPDDEMEQKRTGRHLEKNQYKKAVLENFLEQEKK